MRRAYALAWHPHPDRPRWKRARATSAQNLLSDLESASEADISLPNYQRDKVSTLAALVVEKDRACHPNVKLSVSRGCPSAFHAAS